MGTARSSYANVLVQEQQWASAPAPSPQSQHGGTLTNSRINNYLLIPVQGAAGSMGTDTT